MTAKKRSNNKKVKASEKMAMTDKGPDLNYIGSREESAEMRTIASRSRLREQMDDDVARFLAQGGVINHIERNVLADPPKKPTSNYGEGSI